MADWANDWSGNVFDGTAPVLFSLEELAVDPSEDWERYLRILRSGYSTFEGSPKEFVTQTLGRHGLAWYAHAGVVPPVSGGVHFQTAGVSGGNPTVTIRAPSINWDQTPSSPIRDTTGDRLGQFSEHVRGTEIYLPYVMVKTPPVEDLGQVSFPYGIRLVARELLKTLV